MITLDGSKVNYIESGNKLSLFITNDGKVYSCGTNTYGELGLGDTNTRNTPTLITALQDKKIVKASACNHSLFLTDDGKVYSCGNNSGYNTGGQLGLGDTDNRGTPVLITALQDKKIVKVSAGGGHSLFLTDDGKVYGCGTNGVGQLCLGSFTFYTSPMLIPGLEDKKIVDITAGIFHSLFLTDDGKVYGCGGNYSVQLGVGEVTSTVVYNTPTLVSELQNKKIMNISSRYNHSLFLADDGKVYGCGSNGYGQLCTTDNSDKSIPVLITELENKKIVNISAGYAHSLFLTDDGKVYASGSNIDGELGFENIGDTTDYFTPQLVTSLQNRFITSISCGYDHSLFLAKDGKTYVCGYNYEGQLGLGDDTSKNTPEISMDTTMILSPDVNVSANNLFCLLMGVVRV